MKQIDQEKINKAMIELAHDGILLLDPHGIIIQANPAALSICGFKSLDDIRLQPIKFTDLFDLYDFNHTKVPTEQHPVSRALNGESIIDFKCKGIRKNTGKEGYWLFSASPMSDETKNITAVVLSIKDVSFLFESEKSAQEALISSEILYRSLFDNMLNGFAYCRMLFENGRPKDFIFLIANSAYETLTGLKNVKGKKVSEVIPSFRETDSELFEIYSRVAIGGKPEQFERYVTAIKEWVSVTVYSPKKEYFATVFDVITERKRTEEALEKLSYILSESQKIAHLGTFEYIIDTQTTVWSDEEYHIFGLDPANPSPPYEVMLAKHVHLDDVARLDKTFKTAINSGSIFSIEHRVIRPDGDVRWIYSRAHPYLDRNGKIVRYIGVSLDITERKGAEIRLTERNKFIESIANMSPNILFIYDIVDKKNIYINDSIEKILGYTREEILSMGSDLISSLMHPDDYVQYQKTIIPRYAIAKDNEQIIHEYRMKHKSGEWRRLASNETIYKRQPDGSPRQIFGLVRDITESKAAEEALRESEYFFKESQRTANIGSYKLDFTTGYWKSSEVLDRIFGIGPDYNRSIQGWLDLVHPDDHAMMDKYFREEVASKHQPFRKEYRIIRKSDGIVRWVDGSGRIAFDNRGALISMFGTIQDITGRKLAEETLREERDKLTTIAATVPEAIISYKLRPDGLFQLPYASPAYLDVLGFSPEEVSKDLSPVIEHIHSDDRETVKKAIAESSRTLTPLHKEFRYNHPIKGEVWIDANTVPRREADGGTIWHGFITDITERKLAQEALRLSEEKFSKAFMNSPDSITISRLDNGVFFEINNGSMEMFGYSRNEMIGHASLPGDLNIWVNREDRDQVVESLKIKGEINAFESLFRRKDGSILYGIVSARIIKMNGIDYMLGTIRDVTERKRAEEALRQSEEKFSKAFMISPDALAITRISDGVFIEINNGSMEMFGYSREEMIGHSSLPGDLNLWTNKDDRDKMIAILKTRGEVKAFEMRFRCKDGRIRTGMLSARIIKMNEENYVLTITRDITEQKHAQEALRQSEEKFSKAFMTSPDSISISRLDDGVFIETNNGSTKNFGYSRKEMIGHSPLPDDLNIWVNKEDRDRSVEFLKTKGEINGLETLLRRKDGSILNGIFSARIIKMNGIDYILSTTRDITEQKRAQEALRQSEEKFSKAFMIIPDSITITGLSDGVLVEINNGCMKIFGYTREEMIGHTPLPGDLNIWLTKDDRDRMVAVLNAEGEVNEFETFLRRKDRSILYAIISARIIKMKGKDYLLATIRDITEQKRAKEVQDRLTRELRALSSCNQALVRAENEQTLLDEICRIVYEIAGYRLTWVGLLVKEEAPYLRIVSKAGSGETIIANETYALTDKEETPIDTAVRSRKSSITPDFANAPEESLWSDYALKNGCRSAIALPLLDDAGNSMGVLSIYSGEPNVFAAEEIKLLEELAGDLSFGIVNLRTRIERKLAQRALVYEKELSDALLEASPGIFLVMDNTGRILRMNSNFMKLQGQTRETHTSWEILKFVYKDDYESSKQDLERLSRVGHAEADARFEFKPGEISWWSMSGHAVTIAGTVYMIVTGSDITLGKHAEENLQKALKEKEVLLQELYHRTKNNMQVISSYLAMQAVILEDEKLQPIFNEMENRIRAMALVHEKLYKSKDLTNINLSDYLGDLSKLLFAGFPGASDKVNLVYEIEKIFVTIDIAIPIGLVVTELITNSLKYAFPNGRSGKILMEVRKHDHGELELHISDNGVGAPKGFNLKQKGTLGIPTVLSIVQKQLRGSVEVDTEGGFKWEIIFRSDLYSKRV